MNLNSPVMNKIILAIFIFMNVSLLADTVKLKNGKVYSNVKAYPGKGMHRLQFSNGQRLYIKNEKIAKVRIKPVRWPKRIKIIAKKIVHNKAIEENALPPGLSDQYDLGPVWKSAILPGWGQYMLGHSKRGMIISGATLLVFNQYWSNRKQHTRAQEEFSEQITPVVFTSSFGTNGYLAFLIISEQEKAVLLQKEQDTNNMFGILSLIWSWNVIDAFIISNPHAIKRYPFLEYFRIGLDLETTESKYDQKTGGKLQIGFKIRF